MMLTPKLTDAAAPLLAAVVARKPDPTSILGTASVAFRDAPGLRTGERLLDAVLLLPDVQPHTQLYKDCQVFRAALDKGV